MALWYDSLNTLSSFQSRVAHDLKIFIVIIIIIIIIIIIRYKPACGYFECLVFKKFIGYIAINYSYSEVADNI